MHILFLSFFLLGLAWGFSPYVLLGLCISLISISSILFLKGILFDKKMWTWTLMIMITASILGIGRSMYHLHTLTAMEHTAKQFCTQKNTQSIIHGKVITLATLTKKNEWSFLITTTRDLTIKVLLPVSSHHPPVMGSFINVEGTCTFIDEKWRNLSSTMRDMLFLQIHAHHIRSTSSTSWDTTLMHIRQSLLGYVQYLWPGDTGGLLAGILIGEQGGLSQEITETFKITGLSHIMVVSGFNITLIITFCSSVFGRVRKQLRYPIMVLCIIIFCYFVGGSSAVLRAGLMGILQVGALAHEKPTTVFYLLLFSVFLICLWNPAYLLFDIGFQLSCSAVCGLLFGNEYMKKLFHWLPTKLDIQEILCSTLAAQLFTTPLLLYYFGSLSLISPLSNLLVPPAIAPLMALSTCTLILSPIPLVGDLLIMFTEITTRSIIMISHMLAQIPFAQVTPSHIWWLMLSIPYLYMLHKILYFHMNENVAYKDCAQTSI